MYAHSSHRNPLTGGDIYAIGSVFGGGGWNVRNSSCDRIKPGMPSIMACVSFRPLRDVAWL
jgi:hypothetical protein